MYNVENFHDVNKLMMAPTFWTFLSVQYGDMCTSSVQAVVMICRLLKIEDISDLPFDRNARVEWEKMMVSFHYWLKSMKLR